jgi:kumamolisin
MSNLIYAVRTGSEERVLSEQLVYEESSLERIQPIAKCLPSRIRPTRSRRLAACSVTLAAVLMAAASALGQSANSPLMTANANKTFATNGGHVVVPESSIARPRDIGVRAHTNVRVFFPAAGAGAQSPSILPEIAVPLPGPPGGYFFETPGSLGCVYQLVSSPVAGCNPNLAGSVPTGGFGGIAIVDAFHYPTAMNDLRVFSNQFGLPAPTGANFQVVYANGYQPPVDANWNLEAALDIEWAHAMAPNAKIYLVEAASDSTTDMMWAVWVASRRLQVRGGGEVSMSWGGTEFSSETNYDQYFGHPGIVYLAASGDSYGVQWPSTSPYAISVGGTSISRNPLTGDFQREIAWQSDGGGPSLYEPRPSYQNGISPIVQTQRGTPDVSAVADPTTGVWVYYSGFGPNWAAAIGDPAWENAFPYWGIVGGTSVATPVWAGIANSARGGSSITTYQELSKIYADTGNAADFTDIVDGSCGTYEGYLAVTGWDFCTGVGSPVGTAGK